jgi:hypothetical protein
MEGGASRNTYIQKKIEELKIIQSFVSESVSSILCCEYGASWYGMPRIIPAPPFCWRSHKCASYCCRCPSIFNRGQAQSKSAKNYGPVKYIYYLSGQKEV